MEIYLPREYRQVCVTFPNYYTRYDIFKMVAVLRKLAVQNQTVCYTYLKDIPIISYPEMSITDSVRLYLDLEQEKKLKI